MTQIQQKARKKYKKNSGIYRARVLVISYVNKHAYAFNMLIVHLIMAFFGIAGVLIRVGLTKLTQHNGVLGGVLWANFTGCILMGFLVHDSQMFKHLIESLEQEKIGEIKDSENMVIVANPRTNDLQSFELSFVPNSKAETPETADDDENGQAETGSQAISFDHDEQDITGAPIETSLSPNSYPRTNNNPMADTPGQSLQSSPSPHFESLQPHPSNSSRQISNRRFSVSSLRRLSISSVQSSLRRLSLPHLHLAKRKYSAKTQISLYIGLATGCCGSITSFSSFILECFQLSANIGSVFPFPNPGYGVMLFLAYVIITLSVSVSGFTLGKHISLFVKDFIPGIKIHELAVEVFLALLGLSAWIIVLILAITLPNWRYWMFSCIFAPFGVYIRFWLSKVMNPLIPGFPIGTFTINIGATSLLAVLVILQQGVKPSGTTIISNTLQCQVIGGFQDGLCGNLSTISTFIAELCSLRLRHSYFYAAASIGVGFALMVIILGSYSWTNGLGHAVC